MDAVLLSTLLVPLVAIGATTSASLRARCLAFDCGVLLLSLAAVSWAIAVGTSVPGEATYALLLTRIGIWVLALINGDAAEVRWSAWRVAIVALLFHACTLPQVLSVPIDGDEPYYVLMVESLVADADLDLSNQYASLERSVIGRELAPQPGDPVTDEGAVRSRHEPFLALLLVPAYLLAGLAGSSAVMVLFATLLAWSVVRLLEDAGFETGAIVAGSAFVVFAAPMVSYSVRIWPEIPAALLLSESLRHTIGARPLRSVAALILMALLKLRFVVIAAPLMLALGLARTLPARRSWIFLGTAVAIAVPMTIAYMQSGSPLNVHHLSELKLLTPDAIARGLLGLLLDGQSGVLFVCPILFVSILAVVRHGPAWPGSRVALACMAPYVLLLASRAEWHGGWSPPLRYLVVFAPIGALVVSRAASVWKTGNLLTIAWIGTFASSFYAVALPWRQFHIANGESRIGEWLSLRWESDYSRLIPSFMRINESALWAALALVLLLIVVRFVRISRTWIPPAVPVLCAILLAFGWLGRQPADLVHFEDAHVIKNGGRLDPHEYTVARFLYEGGWAMTPGDSVTFGYVGGPSILRYRSAARAVLEIDGVARVLAPASRWSTALVEIPEGEARRRMRVLDGEVVLESLRVR